MIIMKKKIMIIIIMMKMIMMKIIVMMIMITIISMMMITMIITFHGYVEPVVCKILHRLGASGFLSVNVSTVQHPKYHCM